MYTLTESEAILLVRRNIDEQEYNDSSMAGVDDKDSTAFEELCKKLLPEAINEVHANAPLELLDGTQGNAKLTDFSISSDNVLSFSLPDKILRLVSFRLNDIYQDETNLTLYDLVAETSPEGLMQRNPYTRGSVECPKLVLRVGGENKSLFSYYTTYPDWDSELIDTYKDDSPEVIVEQMEYLPLYRYTSSDTGKEYKIAERVHNNIIDQLTAKVLAVYNSAQASYFFSRAGFGIAQETVEKK